MVREGGGWMAVMRGSQEGGSEGMGRDADVHGSRSRLVPAGTGERQKNHNSRQHNFSHDLCCHRATPCQSDHILKHVADIPLCPHTYTYFQCSNIEYTLFLDYEY